MKPQRIQRQRTKGWNMPENTVYVGRPTKWGNPFRVDRDDNGAWSVVGCNGIVRIGGYASQAEAHAGAVRLFCAYLANDGTQPGTVRDAGGAFLVQLAQEELRGKNLACWCPPNMPCHADVLLEIANAEDA